MIDVVPIAIAAGSMVELADGTAVSVATCLQVEDTPGQVEQVALVYVEPLGGNLVAHELRTGDTFDIGDITWEARVTLTTEDDGSVTLLPIRVPHVD